MARQFHWHKNFFRKRPVRIPPAFLPRPLLRAGNQSRQGESETPDKLFRPAESILLVLIIWILLEIVSNFVQQTPQNKIPRLYSSGGKILNERIYRSSTLENRVESPNKFVRITDVENFSIYWMLKIFFLNPLPKKTIPSN